MFTFLCYPKCSTCAKAEKWLVSHHVPFQKRDISIQNPTAEELAEWHRNNPLPLTKLFNTSGRRYRELNLKEQLKTMSDEAIIELLASDGMLVKRPVLTDGTVVLFGFKEAEWEQILTTR